MDSTHDMTGSPVGASARAGLQEVRAHGLKVSFACVPGVNYALHHCGIPIVSDFRVRNAGESARPPGTVSLAVTGYSEPWRMELPPLEPGGEVRVDRVPLRLRHEVLEGIDARVNAWLRLEIDGEPVLEHPMPVLGFFEWPTDPAFMITLACFVQPSSQVVQDLVLGAQSLLHGECDPPSFTRLLQPMREGAVEKAFKALYDHVSQRCRISYVREAPSFELASQNLRPPQKVILKPGRGAGQGTCIDVSLLFASCLENIHLQPLILFVAEEGSYQHAFVGCWTGRADRFEPVLPHHEKMKQDLEKGRLVVVEATGATDRWGEALDFAGAAGKAREQLLGGRFLFALDVSAARQTARPLQFPMSPVVTRAVREAGHLARQEGWPRLETRHLLAVLLRDGGEVIRKVMADAGADVEGMAKLSWPVPGAAEGLDVKSPRPTANYRNALDQAGHIASDTGEKFVEEAHLFYALLMSGSRGVDDLLLKAGTDREEVLASFEYACPWVMNVVHTVIPG
jgi:hypothetical protein